MTEKDSKGKDNNNYDSPDKDPSWKGLQPMSKETQQQVKAALAAKGGKDSRKADLEDLMKEFEPKVASKSANNQKEYNELMNEFKPKSPKPTMSPEGIPYASPELQEQLRKAAKHKAEHSNTPIPDKSDKTSNKGPSL